MNDLDDFVIDQYGGQKLRVWVMNTNHLGERYAMSLSFLTYEEAKVLAERLLAAVKVPDYLKHAHGMDTDQLEGGDE